MASKLATLEDLYTDLLKDLYSAEKQLVKALPKMAKNAQSPDLQRAFQEHLKQTEGHVERIERIFTELGGSPRGKKCVGMQNLIKEGEEMIGEAEDDATRDAVMMTRPLERVSRSRNARGWPPTRARSRSPRRLSSRAASA